MRVRKDHNSGRNHLRNVIDYYQRKSSLGGKFWGVGSKLTTMVSLEIGHEKAQSVIDSITSSYAAEGQAHANPMLPQNQPGGGHHGLGPTAAGTSFPPPLPFAFPPPGAAGAPPPPFHGLPPPGAAGFPPPPGGAGRAGPGGMPPIPPFMAPGPNGAPPIPPPGGFPFPLPEIDRAVACADA